MIGFINTLYTKLGTTDSRALSLMSKLLESTVAHALGFLVFTSRILATDLSQTHCNFKSHLKSFFQSRVPFLALFCHCRFRRLDSIQFLCSQAHILAGWRFETRHYTLFYLIKFFFITTLHEPHEKHRLIVLGVFAAPLHSNARGANHIENSLSIVEACLPRARVYRVIA
jgi:hypothetical protein